MIHYRSMTQICQLCKLITGHWPDSLASHDCDVDILACAPSSPTHTDETTSTCLKTLRLIGNMAATENQCSCWRLRLPWWRGGGPAAIRLYRSAMYRLSPYLHCLHFLRMNWCIGQAILLLSRAFGKFEFAHQAWMEPHLSVLRIRLPAS